MIAAMVRALWLTTTDKTAGFMPGNCWWTPPPAPPTDHDPALTKSYQRCVAALAALRGTLGAKLWRLWRWLAPTLPARPNQKR